ncbi:hypothetical protein OQA88_1021 [Cercophora sp. LCS_1]
MSAVTTSTLSLLPTPTPPPLSWQNPPISSFNFSRNCTAAGIWVASDEVEYIATLNYIRDSLPDDFSPPPSDYQIFEWFTSNVAHNNQTLYMRMAEVAISECRYEACRSLDWQGIADLAGIGMVITYFLEAGFTSVLLLLLSLDCHFSETSQVGTWLSYIGVPTPHIPYRLSAALYGCLDEFLNSATVFAISMLAASIFENSYNTMTKGEESTVYATLLSILLPIFTVFPVAILQATARGSLRRARLRTTIWMLLVVLVIATSILGMTTFRILSDDDGPDFYADRSAQQSFERWCAPKEDEFSVRPAFKVAAIVFGVFSGVWFVVVFNFMQIPFLETARWAVKLREVWWLVVSGLSFVGMWTYLALFTEYRRLIVERAGFSQQDTRWSVGQVLALATWTPVIVDFLYILVFGPQAGLEGRVSKKWHVSVGQKQQGSQEKITMPQDKAPLVDDVELDFPSPEFPYARSSPREDAELLQRSLGYSPTFRRPG